MQHENPEHQAHTGRDDGRVEQRPGIAVTIAAGEPDQPGDQQRIACQVENVGQRRERLPMEHVHVDAPHAVAGGRHQLPGREEVPQRRPGGPVQPDTDEDEQPVHQTHDVVSQALGHAASGQQEIPADDHHPGDKREPPQSSTRRRQAVAAPLVPNPCRWQSGKIIIVALRFHPDRFGNGPTEMRHIEVCEPCDGTQADLGPPKRYPTSRRPRAPTR